MSITAKHDLYIQVFHQFPFLPLDRGHSNTIREHSVITEIDFPLDSLHCYTTCSILELMCEGQIVSDLRQGMFASENTLTEIDFPLDSLHCYNTLVTKFL